MSKAVNNKVSAEKEKDYDKIIAGKLDTSCSHKSTYYSYGGHTTYTCEACCLIMAEAFDKGAILSNATIKLFMDHVCINGDSNSYYYRDYKCINRNSNNIANTLYTLFLFHNVTSGFLKETMDVFIKECINMKDYDVCMKALADQKYYFTQNFGAIYTRLKDFCDSWDDNEFCYDIIKQLCTTRSTNMNMCLSQLIDKYDGDINMEHLYLACSVLPYSKVLVNVLVSRGLQLDDKCLEIVCKSCDVDAINYVLTTGRVPINKNHFQVLIKSVLYTQPKPTSKYSYGYKGSDTISGYTAEKMETLIKHGYKPDYDDIAFAIKYSKEIPGIERFDIKLDKSLLELCWDYDFYPAYKFDCIDPNMIELQKLCCERSKNNIVKFIKKHKLVPDRKCMENACNFKNNSGIIATLMSSGGKLTYKCIKTCGEKLKASTTLTYIVDQYEKDLIVDIDNYKNRITFLEKKLKELTGEVPEQPVEEEQNKKKKQQRGKKIKKKLKELPDSDDEKEDKPVPAVEPAVEPAVDNKPANNAKILTIEDSALDNIPKQKNRKQTVPEIYAKYFKKTYKVHMSFMDIKKELLDTIREKNWYDKENTNLLNIPADLRVELGLELDSMIQFSDIDKLVGLFYK